MARCCLVLLIVAGQAGCGSGVGSGGGGAPPGCPHAAPYLWSDGTCRTAPETEAQSAPVPDSSPTGCPQQAPHLWSDGSCQTEPESQESSPQDEERSCVGTGTPEEDGLQFALDALLGTGPCGTGGGDQVARFPCPSGRLAVAFHGVDSEGAAELDDVLSELGGVLAIEFALVDGEADIVVFNAPKDQWLELAAEHDLDGWLPDLPVVLDEPYTAGVTRSVDARHERFLSIVFVDPAVHEAASTLRHEFGHALGLVGHPTQLGDSIMANVEVPNIGCVACPFTTGYSAEDLRLLQLLYWHLEPGDGEAEIRQAFADYWDTLGPTATPPAIPEPQPAPSPSPEPAPDPTPDPKPEPEPDPDPQPDPDLDEAVATLRGGVWLLTGWARSEDDFIGLAGTLWAMLGGCAGGDLELADIMLRIDDAGNVERLESCSLPAGGMCESLYGLDPREWLLHLTEDDGCVAPHADSEFIDNTLADYWANPAEMLTLFGVYPDEPCGLYLPAAVTGSDGLCLALEVDLLGRQCLPTEEGWEIVWRLAVLVRADQGLDPISFANPCSGTEQTLIVEEGDEVSLTLNLGLRFEYFGHSVH